MHPVNGITILKSIIRWERNTEFNVIFSGKLNELLKFVVNISQFMLASNYSYKSLRFFSQENLVTFLGTEFLTFVSGTCDIGKIIVTTLWCQMKYIFLYLQSIHVNSPKIFDVRMGV